MRMLTGVALLLLTLGGCTKDVTGDGGTIIAVGGNFINSPITAAPTILKCDLLVDGTVIAGQSHATPSGCPGLVGAATVRDGDHSLSFRITNQSVSPSTYEAFGVTIQAQSSSATLADVTQTLATGQSITYAFAVIAGMVEVLPTITLTITSVSPSSGPLGGGTSVTITGTGFTNVTGVTIGGTALANRTVASSASITGTTPAASTAGAKDVVVTTSAGNGSCAGCFTYNPAPTVMSVSPTSGPRAGGTAVTITGTNFPTTIDSVKVGTGRLGSLVRVSATQLTGTTPASGAAGAVNVTVYTTSAGSAACTGCFTYTTSLWTSLRAGLVHTCGLASGGAAYCWGANQSGQLGDGTTTLRSPPVAVGGGITFASLEAGGEHTCGLRSGGAAYCWGYNLYGELGDGTTTNRSTPVAVTGGITFASLAPGDYHTCGRTSGGAAYCWGYNFDGELGDYTTTMRLTPVAVGGAITFASLEAGRQHTCGLTTGGAAYCWGLNYHGELGDGTTTNRSTPVAVAGGITFASLAPGGYHTCGRTSGGAAYCWGYNGDGALGDYTTTNRLTPVAVGGGIWFASLAAGQQHTCGLTPGAAAYCWGYNGSGELGDGTTANRSSPVAVWWGFLDFQAIAAGYSHTCGITSAGAAYCWGSNQSGQLGDGTTTNRLTPVVVLDP